MPASSIKSTASNAQLKQLLKEALSEILEEKGALFRDVLQETIEDIAMLKAIEEGRKTKYVSRKRIFQQLRKNEHHICSLSSSQRNLSVFPITT